MNYFYPEDLVGPLALTVAFLKSFWSVSFSGLTDDSSPQDAQSEGTDDRNTTQAQEAFVQDSLEAHEEFLEQHQAALEQESSEVEMQEWEEPEDGEQPEQSDVRYREEAEKEEEEDLQLPREPLVTTAPSETLGPGPLVRDVEDVDELETIFLSLKKSLRVDDLPDLPELEAPPSLFSTEQALTPNMGVVSCSDDDDDSADELSRVVPAFALDREPPFTLAAETKLLHGSKAASLLYPEDEDLLELQPHSIFGAAAKSRPLIAPSRPSSLIEEIDDF